jgi:hypothetical protein
MLTIKNIWSKIQLGTYLEVLLSIITLGQSEHIALFIAKRFFGRNECGCCERKEWLNKLTNPNYDGKCNQINLF